MEALDSLRAESCGLEVLQTRWKGRAESDLALLLDQMCSQRTVAFESLRGIRQPNTIA